MSELIPEKGVCRIEIESTDKDDLWLEAESDVELYEIISIDDSEGEEEKRDENKNRGPGAKRKSDEDGRMALRFRPPHWGDARKNKNKPYHCSLQRPYRWKRLRNELKTHGRRRNSKFLQYPSVEDFGKSTQISTVLRFRGPLTSLKLPEVENEDAMAVKTILQQQDTKECNMLAKEIENSLETISLFQNENEEIIEMTQQQEPEEKPVAKRRTKVPKSYLKAKDITTSKQLKPKTRGRRKVSTFQQLKSEVKGRPEVSKSNLKVTDMTSSEELEPEAKGRPEVSKSNLKVTDMTTSKQLEPEERGRPDCSTSQQLEPETKGTPKVSETNIKVADMINSQQLELEEKGRAEVSESNFKVTDVTTSYKLKPKTRGKPKVSTFQQLKSEVKGRPEVSKSNLKVTDMTTSKQEEPEERGRRKVTTSQQLKSKVKGRPEVSKSNLKVTDMTTSKQEEPEERGRRKVTTSQQLKSKVKGRPEVSKSNLKVTDMTTSEELEPEAKGRPEVSEFNWKVTDMTTSEELEPKERGRPDCSTSQQLEPVTKGTPKVSETNFKVTDMINSQQLELEEKGRAEVSELNFKVTDMTTSQQLELEEKGRAEVSESNFKVTDVTTSYQLEPEPKGTPEFSESYLKMTDAVKKIATGLSLFRHHDNKIGTSDTPEKKAKESHDHSPSRTSMKISNALKKPLPARKALLSQKSTQMLDCSKNVQNPLRTFRLNKNEMSSMEQTNSVGSSQTDLQSSDATRCTTSKKTKRNFPDKQVDVAIPLSNIINRTIPKPLQDGETKKNDPIYKHLESSDTARRSALTPQDKNCPDKPSQLRLNKYESSPREQTYFKLRQNHETKKMGPIHRYLENSDAARCTTLTQKEENCADKPFNAPMQQVPSQLRLNKNKSSALERTDLKLPQDDEAKNTEPIYRYLDSCDAEGCTTATKQEGNCPDKPLTVPLQEAASQLGLNENRSSAFERTNSKLSQDHGTKKMGPIHRYLERSDTGRYTTLTQKEGNCPDKPFNAPLQQSPSQLKLNKNKSSSLERTNAKLPQDDEAKELEPIYRYLDSCDTAISTTTTQQEGNYPDKYCNVPLEQAFLSPSVIYFQGSDAARCTMSTQQEGNCSDKAPLSSSVIHFQGYDAARYTTSNQQEGNRSDQYCNVPLEQAPSSTSVIHSDATSCTISLQQEGDCPKAHSQLRLNENKSNPLERTFLKLPQEDEVKEMEPIYRYLDSCDTAICPTPIQQEGIYPYEYCDVQLEQASFGPTLIYLQSSDDARCTTSTQTKCNVLLQQVSSVSTPIYLLNSDVACCNSYTPLQQISSKQIQDREYLQLNPTYLSTQTSNSSKFLTNTAPQLSNDVFNIRMAAEALNLLKNNSNNAQTTATIPEVTSCITIHKSPETQKVSDKYVETLLNPSRESSFNSLGQCQSKQRLYFDSTLEITDAATGIKIPLESFYLNNNLISPTETSALSLEWKKTVNHLPLLPDALQQLSDTVVCVKVPSEGNNQRDVSTMDQIDSRYTAINVPVAPETEDNILYNMSIPTSAGPVFVNIPVESVNLPRNEEITKEQIQTRYATLEESESSGSEVIDPLPVCEQMSDAVNTPLESFSLPINDGITKEQNGSGYPALHDVEETENHVSIETQLLLKNISTWVKIPLASVRLPKNAATGVKIPLEDYRIPRNENKLIQESKLSSITSNQEASSLEKSQVVKRDNSSLQTLDLFNDDNSSPPKQKKLDRPIKIPMPKFINHQIGQHTDTSHTEINKKQPVEPRLRVNKKFYSLSQGMRDYMKRHIFPYSITSSINSKFPIMESVNNEGAHVEPEQIEDKGKDELLEKSFQISNVVHLLNTPESSGITEPQHQQEKEKELQKHGYGTERPEVPKKSNVTSQGKGIEEHKQKRGNEREGRYKIESSQKFNVDYLVDTLGSIDISAEQQQPEKCIEQQRPGNDRMLDFPDRSAQASNVNIPGSTEARQQKVKTGHSPQLSRTGTPNLVIDESSSEMITSATSAHRKRQRIVVSPSFSMSDISENSWDIFDSSEYSEDSIDLRTNENLQLPAQVSNISKTAFIDLTRSEIVAAQHQRIGVIRKHESSHAGSQIVTITENITTPVLKNDVITKEKSASQPKGTGNTVTSPLSEFGKTIKTPLDAFMLLINDSMVRRILKYTNAKMQKLASKSKCRNTFRHIADETELKAFLGLLLISAAMKQNTINIPEIFSECFGGGIYRATLQEARFQVLTQGICFGDNMSRIIKDVHTPTGDIWEEYLYNCKKYSVISQIMKPNEKTENTTNSGTVDDDSNQIYTTERKTVNGTLRTLFSMLDGAGIRGLTIFRYYNPKVKICQREFLKQVGMGLVRPHLQSRLSKPSLKKSIRELIETILNKKSEIDQLAKRPAPYNDDGFRKQKRCQLCTWNKDRKTKYQCVCCSRAMCRRHRTNLCVDCGNEFM